MNKKSMPKRNLNFEDDDFLFSDSVKTGSGSIRRRGVKRKNEYIIFYGLAAVISITVLVILTTVFLNQFGAENQSTVEIPIIDDPGLINILEESEEADSLLGLITNIDYTNRVLVIRNLDTRTPSNFVVQNSSDLRGRLGNALIFEELNIGDIVDIEYVRTSVVSLVVSNDAWEERAVSGLEIISEGEINIGGEIFALTSDTLVMHGSNVYNINNLSSLNQVNVRGIGRTVWFIEVSGGFGAMQVINSSGVINGTLHIDGSTMPLGPTINPLDQIIELSEGMHRAVIHGDNINTETREIHISANETFILDLASIELTAGNLLVNLNAPSANVFINGIQRDIEYPILLYFGTHTISVIATGFANYERVFEFETNNQTVHISLVPGLAAQNEPPQSTGTDNNNQTGTEAPPEGEVPGGGHLVGGFPQTSIPPAQNTARVDIRSAPSGASLFVDEVLVGTTPFTGNLNVGSRSIRLQLNGFINTQATLEVVAGNNNPVYYELQPMPTLPQPGFELPPPVEHVEEDTTPPPAIDVPPLNTLPPINNDPSLPPTIPSDPPPGGMPDPSLPTIPPSDDDFPDMPVMPGLPPYGED